MTSQSYDSASRARHSVNERHMAAAESVERFVLERRWYEMARVLAKDEDIAKRKYSYSQLSRAFIVLGYYCPPTRSFYSHAIRAYRKMQTYRIQRESVRGIDEKFVNELLLWYEKDVIDRITVQRLLRYRKRFANRQHPVSMRVFDIHKKDVLQKLIRHERTFRTASPNSSRVEQGAKKE